METSTQSFKGLEEFVKAVGGIRAIKKVLIANNGIAAVKAIRSVRKWAYEMFGRENEILFVVMATPEDLKANAEYIRMADEVAEVPGGRNLNNYANVQLIVQLALKYQVDGVWPGWGHASENPLLPNTLEKHNIVFIGPPGGPMYALGDKIGSTIIAQNANVPVIAWNALDLKHDYKASGTIPPDVYNSACLKSAEECVAAVTRIGVPVMIKASEGGGGKGIRKVLELENVASAFRQVQSEVPGSPIFVMKLASQSRHLEVQLLCDMYGQAIALSGRDCSVQRRHQKIIEEGPPTAAKPSVWKEMERAAVRLAKEVSYVNAGTVEYLYKESDNSFFFLELNPRLQVEHPVTEMITGVNLPAAQFQVAMGIALHRIPDIRRFYGLENDMFGSSPIDFDNTDPRGPDGHVIAARITAENPYKGFQPTSGRIQELNFRSSRNVWGYFSVDSSGRVHEFADSQFGHIFASGPTREAARKHLVLALNDLSIRGDIRTTVEYLKQMLEDEDYRANRIDTSWLDERIKNHKEVASVNAIVVVLVGAGCEAYEYAQKQEADYVSQVSRGQLPSTQLLKLEYKSELICEGIKYQLVSSRTGPSSFSITLGGRSVDMDIRCLADGGYLVMLDGKSHVAYLKPEVGAKRLTLDGHTHLFVDEYDPTQIRAAMGGKLVRYLVEDGQNVPKDFAIAEVEVMKMNMPLLSPESGKVNFVKPAGSVMEPGDVICGLVLDDESKIQRSKVFTGSIPEFGEPTPIARADMPHDTLNHAVSILQNAMNGYIVSVSKQEAAIEVLNQSIRIPAIPALSLLELLSRIKNTMPGALYEMLVKLSEEYLATLPPASQPASDELIISAGSYARKAIESSNAYAKNAPQAQEKELTDILSQIHLVMNPFKDGMQNYYFTLVNSLLRRYLAVEARFAELESSDHPVKEDVIQNLRREHASNLKNVFDVSLSHAGIKAKNRLALRLLESLELCVRREEELLQLGFDVPMVDSSSLSQESPERKSSSSSGMICLVRDESVRLLRDLAALNVESTNDIALESRQILIELQKPSYAQSLSHIEDILRQSAAGNVEARNQLVHSTEAILHFIMEIILSSKDDTLRTAAFDLYVRRVYNTYTLVDLTTKKIDDKIGIVASWHFHAESNEVVGPTSTLTMPGAESFDNLQALLSSTTQNKLSIAGDKTIPSATGTSTTGSDSETDSRPLASMNRMKSTTRLRAGSGWEGEAGDDAGSLRSGEVESAEMESITKDQQQLGGKFSGGDGVAPEILRHALLGYFENISAMSENFESFLKLMDPKQGSESVNALHIILSEKPSEIASTSITAGSNEEVMASKLQSFLSERLDILKTAGVRRVTFAVPAPHHSHYVHSVVSGHGSGFYTFRARTGFQEDRLVRHIETPLAFQLDLKRLSNFNISLVPLGKHLSLSHTVHVYQATPKNATSSSAGNAAGNEDDEEGGGSRNASKVQKRYFVRALVRQASRMDNENTPDDAMDAYPGPERILVQALAALEAVQGGSGHNTSSAGAQNHIFLNILGDASVDPVFVEKACRRLARRYAKRLLNARVAEVELKVNARLDNQSPILPVRLVSSNPTGFALRVDSYVEAADPHFPSRTLFYSITSHDGGVGASLAAMGLDSGQKKSLHSGNTWSDSSEEAAGVSPMLLGGGLGSLHGLDVSSPYPSSTPYDERRAKAIAGGTCFVYDIPALFQKALENEWRSFAWKRDHVIIPPPGTLMRVQELVLDDEMDTGASFGHGLAVTQRPPGSNKIAMVAWHIRLITPQYQAAPGREVIVIANDLTFKAGSFGTREDDLFARASAFAREKGIPRLYIAANSGARIGIAEEVKRAFKAKFVDDSDPSKGFSYVYLEPNDYKLLGPEGRKSVIAEPVMESESSSKVLHYKLTAIVGEGRDLGVENLRGSGLIAGETSRAYDEIFTATYVAGRSVGIGAYLIRLGQRTIQKGTNAPIILTGYQALNSLMGRNVYTSNAQIGGPTVMYSNGVTHQCVRDDLEGIAGLIQWLSYVPERRGAKLPLTTLPRGDVIDRDVLYMPSKDVPSDPRLMFTGVEGPNGWISGLFDKGSWVEMLGGWAKTVVTGRARLGQIPVGVIIPENRTVECIKPADPAAIDSKESLIMQAGNVWFPDSSFKTAQAIKDINREGLPLIFVANFRGFSGGQRDMFDEILKFGSMIVDALVEMKQPVIVYLPPFGELRGGAWVVMDPTINEDMMEMYAAPESRGGVLEPAGTTSIKFRHKDIITAIHRVDHVVIDLEVQLSKLEDAEEVDQASVKSIKAKIEEREKKLLPVYKQLALEVADLHDRPGRMMAKKVISGVVPWTNSRRFFYARLRRRLAEDEVVHALVREGGLSSIKEAREALKSVGEVYLGSGSSWASSDLEVYDFIQSPQGQTAINNLRISLREERIVKQVTALGMEDGNAVLKGMMGIVQKLGENGRIADRDQFVQTLRRGVFLLGSGGSSSTGR